MRLLCTIFIVAFFGIPAFAQPYYSQRPEFLKANSVWALGMGAGFDFNSDGPLPVQTASFAYEGCASVADRTTGKLLFSSNGGEVYNADGRVMPGGDSLFGSARYPLKPRSEIDASANYSTTQGVCIVPVIGDDRKYYLFSLKGITSREQIHYGSLFYSIVDMDLDGGMGGVVQGKKNILLDNELLSEAMVAVPGDNCDIWLVVHLEKASEFRAYHITGQGIDTAPVISAGGNPIGVYGVGSMAVSPDRRRIVIGSVIAGAEMGRFDPATGKITDLAKVFEGYPYSVCFSPGNSKLYFGEVPGNIYQLDLSVDHIDSIKRSRTAVTRIATYPSLRSYGEVIYLAHAGEKSLHRINLPDQKVPACDLQKNLVSWTFNGIPGNTLGAEVVSLTRKDTIFTSSTTFTCEQEGSVALAAPEGFGRYEWEDGDTSAHRTVRSAGTYWVIAHDFCQPRIDSFFVEGFDFVAPVIARNVEELSTTLPYATYQWLLNGLPIPGAVQRKCIAPGDGDYQVVVANERGCTDTSDNYKVTGLNETHIEPGSGQQSVRVYPNPAADVLYINAPATVSVCLYGADGRLLRQQYGAAPIALNEIPSGLYWLKISDSQGRLIRTEKLLK